ncbi:hypothetical protein AOP6_0122 [Desulfuromonas sp. AOP6]|nr:hypothetical protein AOP6_0122 [Desulfuromonas sp. AOP6]
MILNASNKPIGLGAGLGLAAVLVLIGFVTSLFLLWSVSCLGGGAFLLASGFC